MRAKVIVTALLLVLALVLAACASDTGTKPPETVPADSDAQESPSQETTPAEGSTSSAVAPPGLYDQADGTVQALGILTYRDAEGGFWAVVNTPIPEEADTADVIAVVKPDDDIEGSMEPNKGNYVSITGTLEDSDAYQAGPFMEGRTLEVVTDLVVE